MTTDDDMREEIQGLGTRFDGLEQKFGGLEQKFGGLEQRFGGLEQKFDGLEKKVDGLPTRADLAGFRDEIINNFRILAEEAKAGARLAAEGFDGTLKRIERDLGDLKQEMVTKFSDHGQALANHHQRLLTLERRRRRTKRD
ncbi:MAG: hypothetical protein Q8T13_17100 [Acidobacteriota bacterium]|nr:hypothetical protein [Acidobacteriota bacterium]